MFEARNPTGFRDADRLRLSAALAASLVFHGLVLGADRLIDRREESPPPSPPPLEARLDSRLPPPVLLAPETPRAPATSSAPTRRPERPPPRPASRGIQVTDAASQALRQIARQLLYPPEAVAGGLEGEALVMLFLDDAGNALAARLEKSSGHRILDDAAVRAAQEVRALPDGAPREVLLPVRFRLR